MFKLNQLGQYTGPCLISWLIMGYGCYEKMGKLYGNAFFVKIEGMKFPTQLLGIDSFKLRNHEKYRQILSWNPSNPYFFMEKSAGFFW